MASVDLIKASNGSGPAARATLTSSRAIGVYALTVNSASNYPATFIAELGTIDPMTNMIDVTTVQVVNCTLTAPTTITIDSWAPGYSDLGNAPGDVVIIRPTTEWANNLADVLDTSHTDTGALNSTALTQAVTATQTAATTTGWRTKPRILSDTSQATLTPDIDDYNIYSLSAQAAALTVAAPAGTPNDGDAMIIRLKDNGTARAITWNAAYENISGLSNLATTVINKWHVIGMLYNAGTSKWQIVSITTSA